MIFVLLPIFRPSYLIAPIQNAPLFPSLQATSNRCSRLSSYVESLSSVSTNELKSESFIAVHWFSAISFFCISKSQATSHSSSLPRSQSAQRCEATWCSCKCGSSASISWALSSDSSYCSPRFMWLLSCPPDWSLNRLICSNIFPDYNNSAIRTLCVSVSNSENISARHGGHSLILPTSTNPDSILCFDSEFYSRRCTNHFLNFSSSNEATVAKELDKIFSRYCWRSCGNSLC